MEKKITKIWIKKSGFHYKLPNSLHSNIKPDYFFLNKCIINTHTLLNVVHTTLSIKNRSKETRALKPFNIFVTCDLGVFLYDIYLTDPV